MGVINICMTFSKFRKKCGREIGEERLKNLDKTTYVSNFSCLRYFWERCYGGCPKMSRNRIAAPANESYRRVKIGKFLHSNRFINFLTHIFSTAVFGMNKFVIRTVSKRQTENVSPQNTQLSMKLQCPLQILK